MWMSPKYNQSQFCALNEFFRAPDNHDFVSADWVANLAYSYLTSRLDWSGLFGWLDVCSNVVRVIAALLHLQVAAPGIGNSRLAVLLLFDFTWNVNFRQYPNLDKNVRPRKHTIERVKC